MSNGAVSGSGRAEPVRKLFPIFENNEVMYFDSAATTQKPQAVLDAVINYYETANSNVGRGFYDLSMRSSELFENARATVKNFINAENAHEVVFTRNTTESVNLVAATYGRSVVGSGDEVIVTALEHHSNLLPWRRLCEEQGATLRVLDISDDGRVSVDGLRAVINDRTKVVAMGHVSNVLGTLSPVRELVAEAHRHGATVVVDGAQAVARQPVDVQDIDADFYCFSGHKVYGPMGIGVLYGKEHLLAPLNPYQSGGGTVTDVVHDEPIVYKDLPHRLEAGTPDVAGAVGLGAALDFLRDVDFDWVVDHDRALTEEMADALAGVPGVQLYGPDAPHRSGSVSFGVEGLHPYDVGNHLNSWGISVRTGVHCAMPLLDRMELLGTVRASVGVYNDSKEIEAFAKALRAAEPGIWTRERAGKRRP